jgi:hypothetical protein
MNRKMQIHEVTEIYKNLDSTVQDKTWIDSHSEDDVKLLTDARDVTLNLLTQVGVFIDLFHQYVDLIQANAIFAEDYQEQPEQDGDVKPTQTPAPAANRAERRAVKKSEPILPQGADNA